MTFMRAINIAGLALLTAGLVAGQEANRAWEEYHRLDDALDKETKTARSGDLSSLRWRVATLEKQRALLPIACPVGCPALRGTVDGLLKLWRESLKESEDYLQKYGREKPLPCDDFFKPEITPGETEVTSKLCMYDMPKKWPGAWAFLIQEVPSASPDNGPTHNQIYRAFVRAGVARERPVPPPEVVAPDRNADRTQAQQKPIPPPALEANRNADFEAFLAYVAGKTGLPRDLQPVVVADTSLRPSACAEASIKNGRRVITYNPANKNCNYTFTIPEPGQRLGNWNFIQLLTHELGHHAGTPKDSNGIADQEAADEWSGRAMAKLGLPENEMKNVREHVRSLNWAGEGINADAQALAFERGWKRGRKKAKTDDVTPPPPPLVVTQTPPPPVLTQTPRPPAVNIKESSGFIASVNGGIDTFTNGLNTLIKWVVWIALSVIGLVIFGVVCSLVRGIWTALFGQDRNR